MKVQSIPPFVIPARHPHPPTHYIIRVRWTSSTGIEATSACPPNSKTAAAGWRDASQWLFALVAYLLAVVSFFFGFARATSISPRTTVAHLVLYPIALQRSEQAERASIQQNKTTKQTKEKASLKFHSLFKSN